MKLSSRKELLKEAEDVLQQIRKTIELLKKKTESPSVMDKFKRYEFEANFHGGCNEVESEDGYWLDSYEVQTEIKKLEAENLQLMKSLKKAEDILLKTKTV